MERQTFETSELVKGRIKDNGIVVAFGNTVGRVERNHILRHYHCQMGKITGRSGKCYVICVYHLNQRDTPTIGLLEEDFIEKQIKDFYVYAAKNPDKLFYVSYETLDAVFSGYSIKQMGDFFSKFAIPDNVIFDRILDNCII